MRKYRWAVIAGVCILALLIVAGVIFIPRLPRLLSSHVEDSTEIVKPGHWWKTDLSEEELKTLQTLWGRDINARQLIEAMWPDVLQEMPTEMTEALAQRKAMWPVDDFEAWRRVPMMNFGRGVPSNEGMEYFGVYIGSSLEEEITFRQSKDRALSEDRCYRISMYTDEVIDYRPGPLA